MLLSDTKDKTIKEILEADIELKALAASLGASVSDLPAEHCMIAFGMVFGTMAFDADMQAGLRQEPFPPLADRLALFIALATQAYTNMATFSSETGEFHGGKGKVN